MNNELYSDLHPAPSGIVARAFPFLRWFPLSGSALRADLIAGITISALLVPQSMAYAELMGLPAQCGLYGAFLPVIAGALWGSCRQLATGPTAMISLLTAAVITGACSADAPVEERIRLAIVLSCMSGVVLLAMGMVRWSFVLGLVSRPVLLGFTNAAALIIALSQFPALLGLHVPRSRCYLVDLWNALQDIAATNGAVVVVGVGSLVVLLVLHRLKPRWPGMLIVLVVTTVASWLSGYESRWHGDVVGAIPRGLPSLRLPQFDLDTMRRLVPGAVVIALIGFMEVMAISKAIAARTRQRLDLDQEMIGQGLANLLGSFAMAPPASGSFSRSAATLAAGGRSGISSIVTAMGTLVTLVCLTPLMHHLPRATLAAVIMTAVITLADVPGFLHIWRTSKLDGVTGCITFVTCVLLAPHISTGIFIGVMLALVFHLGRMMRPHVAVLGRHADGTFRDAVYHKLPTDDLVVLLRFDGRLFFGNAEHFERSVLNALAAKPQARAVLVVADGINVIDSSGVVMLEELAHLLRTNGILFGFSEMKWRPLRTLEQAGFVASLGPDCFFRTTDSGITALKQKCAP